MKKYLMLDRRLLSPQAMENVRMEVSRPVKDAAHNPLFTQDQPWEVRIDNGYPNVLYDEEAGLYRCYYTLFIEDEDSRLADRRERSRRDYIPRPDRAPGLAYAQSRDGIHWEKPSLGRVQWNGSAQNNIIFAYAHGTGVMIDQRDPDKSRRYKMVTKMDQPGTQAYMAVSFSSDGLDWCDPIPWPEYNPPADSHNLPFWDEEQNCYALLSRIWKDGIRITTLSRCKDFLHWSEPQETLRGSGFENQIYAMPAFRWGNLYLGLASMIHEGDRLSENFDCVDLELTWAADPAKFDFVAAGQHLIQRGAGVYLDGDFDCGCIYASPPVTSPDGKMWVYYMGSNGRHTNWRDGALGRAEWKPDKFAALTPRQPERDSVVATCRLRVSGEKLEILADVVENAGEYKLEAELSPFWNSRPFDGFSYGDSRVEQNAGGWWSVRFAGGLEQLAGEKVSLKLRLRNVKLWALRGDVEMAEHRLWEGAQ